MNEMPWIEDEYDRRAYARLMHDFDADPSRFARLTGRAGTRVGGVGRRVAERLPSAVGGSADQVLRGALKGLQALTLDPALRSVRTSRVVAGFTRAGVEIDSIEDARLLPLRTIDRVTPGLSWRYALASAAGGAAAGAVITGSEIFAVGATAATAGVAGAPTAGTIAGAIAGDAAATLALSGRVVAHVGAYYGYDTRLPEEQVFALTVISWSSATGEGAKVAAFQQLSRITQQLVRGATWAQLSEHALVKVVQEMYLRLGLRLTKAKLGQTVPVLGIAIGAGLNAHLINSAAVDAHRAYRARHLSEKYGMSFEDRRSNNANAVERGGDVIDVSSMVSGELDAENGTDD